MTSHKVGMDISGATHRVLLKAKHLVTPTITFPNIYLDNRTAQDV